MTEFALAPYFHPTTVVFIDDNESFLRSLDLELPGGWACKTFTDPTIALEFVQRQPTLPPLMDRCFTLQRRSPSEVLIHLDLNLIEQEINHRERFARIGRRRGLLNAGNQRTRFLCCAHRPTVTQGDADRSRR